MVMMTVTIYEAMNESEIRTYPVSIVVVSMTNLVLNYVNQYRFRSCKDVTDTVPETIDSIFYHYPAVRIVEHYSVYDNYCR